MRFPKFLIATTAAGAIALAACGGGRSYGAPTPTNASSPAASGAAVKTGSTRLGDVLVDSTGVTLYALTDDVNGKPTCVDACAATWPPLTVASSNLPSGLDAKVFSVVERPDHAFQLAAHNWPLYRFAGDSKPGDTNGQGSGGVWFVLTPSGALNKSS